MQSRKKATRLNLVKQRKRINELERESKARVCMVLQAIARIHNFERLGKVQRAETKGGGMTGLTL